ncbi:diguanylate cyclase domain-containing protein [Aurantimonas sp. VKM B-3413]|uniref:diguanylate cyclase domain-containing protein n=1 Tax=Aurantimonas sp. VKM B-3413 TaxID=2779401 RepID=UPI001E41C03D|nr:diguanylate cyclase [Aurantimonas sp. VKM B-3413]MCB8838294.1 diguanylate cyclase [Aurantimonas sp. VKM B-3413]
MPKDRHRLFRLLALNLAIGLIYILGMRATFGFSELMPAASHWATWIPIWLPAGVLLAFVLRYGAWVAPGAWLGSMAADALAGSLGQASFFFSTIHVLQPLLIRALLIRWRTPLDTIFLQTPSAFRFIVITAGAIFFFGAILGGLMLSMPFDQTTLPRLLENWCRWGLADLAATLVITPPVHLALNNRSDLRQALSASALLAISFGLLLTVLVFVNPMRESGFSVLPASFVLFPLVVWSGLRQRPLDTALLVTTLVMAVCTATATGEGPFAAAADPSRSLFLLQGFIVAISVTGLLLSATNTELLTAQRQLRAIVDGLDLLVDERTAELNQANRRLQAEIASGQRTGTIIRGHSVIMEMLATGRGIPDIAACLVKELRRVEPSWRAAILIPDDTGKWRILGAGSDEASFARTAAMLRRDPSALLPNTAVATMQKRAAHAFQIRGAEPADPGPPMHFEPIPLGGEELVAVLAIRPSTGSFAEPFDIELVQDTARLAGIVLDNRRSQERLRHAATHDTLTGALNRHGFFDAITGRFSASQAEGKRLAIFYIDLDGFKVVNDACGHEVGDRLLVEISGRFASLLGPKDLLCRLGGDEFVVAHAGITDPAAADALADRMIAACRSPRSLKDTALAVTPSIGICLYDDPAAPIGAILDQADAAMYSAKRNGGGRAAWHEQQQSELARSA